MSTMRYIEKLASAPWLAGQEHVEFLHGIYLRYLDRAASGEPFDVKALEEELGRPLDNSREVTVRDGVARIPVTGTIARRANLFTAISGGVSTEVLARDLVAARDDPAVHSILMVFDSPGGEAHGVNELAGMIRDIRESGDTRIESYCDGDCASAAYWLASATSRITTDATASLGSIGVVTRVRNPEAADKREPLEFWNARSPKKRVDPTSQAGRDAIQAHVDALGDEFIGAVADNRGVSAETVASDFGQGFVVTGRRAVEVGLADALGSEEEVVRRLQRREAKMVDARNVADGAPMPVTADTREAEGVMSRLRSMLGLEAASTAVLEETTNGGSNVKLEDRDGTAVLVADSGEELTLSAEDRDRLAGMRDEEMTAELEAARADRDRYKASYEEALGSARTEAVQREMEAFVADGAPPYLMDLARPALVAGYNAAEGSPEAAEATRWRSVLKGSKGQLEHGERGSANGQSAGEMSDDQKIRSELAKRELGMESYGAVAGELVAAGEIDRSAVEASQEGE